MPFFFTSRNALCSPFCVCVSVLLYTKSSSLFAVERQFHVFFFFFFTFTVDEWENIFTSFDDVLWSLNNSKFCGFPFFSSLFVRKLFFSSSLVLLLLLTVPSIWSQCSFFAGTNRIFLGSFEREWKKKHCQPNLIYIRISTFEMHWKCGSIKRFWHTDTHTHEKNFLFVLLKRTSVLHILIQGTHGFQFTAKIFHNFVYVYVCVSTWHQIRSPCREWYGKA